MKRVLIVEDDTIFAGILAKSLRRRGFHVEKSHDLDGAKTSIRENQPDAVLLDVCVNGENGLNLIPFIQSMGGQTRIVVLSSFGDPRTAVWAIRSGAAEYLPKPADIEEIIFALNDNDVSIPKSFISPEAARDAHIIQFFAMNNCNVSRTARNLGMHRRTLQRILDRLNSVAPSNSSSRFSRARSLVKLWSRLLGASGQDHPNADAGRPTSQAGA